MGLGKWGEGLVIREFVMEIDAMHDSVNPADAQVNDLVTFPLMTRFDRDEFFGGGYCCRVGGYSNE